MEQASAVPCADAATALQRRTDGGSAPELHAAALSTAEPKHGLSWIDIGAGTGEVLRSIRDEWTPKSLVAIDLLPWLAPDLLAQVDLRVGDAIEAAAGLAQADRVILVETLEHVEAPWSLLRTAARLVKPGGILVVTTPNITSLRHRLELMVRGQLTCFRPSDPQHLTPILPHVSEAILLQEGLEDVRRTFAGRDVLPLTGGRVWPAAAARHVPSLLNISVVTVARRPVRETKTST